MDCPPFESTSDDARQRDADISTWAAQCGLSTLTRHRLLRAVASITGPVQIHQRQEHWVIRSGPAGAEERTLWPDAETDEIGSASPDNGSLLEAALDALDRRDDDLRQLTQTAERADAAARSAVTARDELLRSIAHDLRNPLNAVVSAADLLLERVTQENPHDPDDLVALSAAIIQRSAGRMDRLLRDLIDLSRIESGQLAVARTACDAQALLEQCIASIQPLANQHEVHVQGHCTVSGSLYCDRERVLQILGSLVAHAVRATAGHGVVSIAMDNDDGGTRLSVTDGVEASSSGSEAGCAAPAGERRVGLGLTIASGLVNAHGSQLRIRRATGGSTHYSFVLPRVAQATR